MTDINNSILQKASGENRLNPDEQRLYLGTYRERVLLTVDLAEAGQLSVKETFSLALDRISNQHSPVQLKLSASLAEDSQTLYMKQAQAAQIPFTLVEERGAQSPFGLLLHTDHAVNLDKLDIFEQFPDLKTASQTKVSKKKLAKISFWGRLFGG